MNLKKIGKVFTSKFVGTGPSSYEKRIYRAAVSQRLRYTVLEPSECKRSVSHTLFQILTKGNCEAGSVTSTLTSAPSLDAFAKLRKATVSSVMSSLSVRPYAATRLPLVGFSRNLILIIFRKLSRENSSSFQIGQEQRKCNVCQNQIELI